MRIEDVIESLNKYINEERLRKGIRNINSFLVLKKSITPSTTFKAYKDFRYEVYVVNRDYTYKAIMCNQMNRATTDNEVEYIKTQIEMELCKMLFEWTHSYDFEQILTGNYSKE